MGNYIVDRLELNNRRSGLGWLIHIEKEKKKENYYVYRWWVEGLMR